MITVSSSPKRAMLAAMIGRRVCSSVRFCVASIHFGKISSSRSSGTSSPVYAGVSKAETVTTFHPDRGLQICAKCDEGSSGLPIASTRPFELVAKASTASKIDFGTPQACLPTSVDSAHDSHGAPIDRDQPAELFPPGPRLLLAIDRDAARKAAPAMSPADERHRIAWTCLVVGSCRCKRVFSLVSSHHPTAREAP